jgi:hypothetical protein
VKAAKALAAILLPAAALTTILAAPWHKAAASTACPAGHDLHHRQTPGPRPRLGHTGPQFTVEDKNGAPMAWVNLYGLYSGGDGGLMPGGLVCVTYKTSASVACLTPEGDLTLTPTGKNGPTGPARTLTPADINWLHKAEKRGLK